VCESTRDYFLSYLLWLDLYAGFQTELYHPILILTIHIPLALLYCYWSTFKLRIIHSHWVDTYVIMYLFFKWLLFKCTVVSKKLLFVGTEFELKKKGYTVQHELLNILYFIFIYTLVLVDYCRWRSIWLNSKN